MNEPSKHPHDERYESLDQMIHHAQMEAEAHRLRIEHEAMVERRALWGLVFFLTVFILCWWKIISVFKDYF
jgi:hypothetical protein